LSYEYAKDHTPKKRVSIGSEDPMDVLMAKLAGIPLKKPRLRTGHNIWGSTNRQRVDAVYEERVRADNVPMKRRATLRMQIYKELFDALDDETKQEYEKRAVEEHEAAVKKIDETLNSPPSQNPVDRQQYVFVFLSYCIYSDLSPRVLKDLPGFVQPILDLIADYTGWKATLLVGGPEPADQGRLNIMRYVFFC
jgi:hypothetical protein